MSHQVRANLADLKSLSLALKDLLWYTEQGGYRLAGVEIEAKSAVWQLETVAAVTAPTQHDNPGWDPRRKTVEPGDQVIVETKGQQLTRRHNGAAQSDGVEGTVFRVLTRGPHPHGMKVELRDRTVGRVKRNLTVPGAGEPQGS